MKQGHPTEVRAKRPADYEVDLPPCSEPTADGHRARGRRLPQVSVALTTSMQREPRTECADSTASRVFRRISAGGSSTAAYEMVPAPQNMRSGRSKMRAPSGCR
jgi:hypothetical protein